MRVGHQTYSVPSRLMGHFVEARRYADTIEIIYKKKPVEIMPRVRGEGAARIDYRHVIWSFVTKPGAFARYRYREELFPSLTFCRAYDALKARPERADIEYLRILHPSGSKHDGASRRGCADRNPRRGQSDQLRSRSRSRGADQAEGARDRDPVSRISLPTIVSSQEVPRERRTSDRARPRSPPSWCSVSLPRAMKR